MFKLRSFVSLSMLSFMLASSTVLAGRIEDLGDAILREEKRNAYIDRRIGVTPQQEILNYQDQTFVKGAVDGSGNCIIDTLGLLFPDKNITRRSFIDALRFLIEQDNQDVKSDLAYELFYQLHQQHLQPDENIFIEFNGLYIDQIKKTLDYENMNESIQKIESNADVLENIVQSLSRADRFLSLSDDPNRLGTFGIACKLFHLNLDVYVQRQNNPDELDIRRQFRSGEEYDPIQSALFSVGGAHVSPLADLNDYGIRTTLADSIYDKMMYHGLGIYETVAWPTLKEAMESWHKMENAAIEAYEDEQYAKEQAKYKYDYWKQLQEDTNEDHSISLLDQLEETVHPQVVDRNPEGGLFVQTDNNANANYQLRSKPLPVTADDLLWIYYDIAVADDGKMALGWLNTNKDGWYGSELVLGPGKHEGFYKRIVPAGEKEASLVLRNYHLGTPGETAFFLESLDFEKQEGLKATVFPKRVIKDESGKITVTTDHNAEANYQLHTIPYAVAEDDILMVPYKISVLPGGKMALGWLNTAKNGWYGEELVLEEGNHKGTYKRIVPAGEKEASLVFRNYHLGTPGESTFTVKYYEVEKEEKLKLKSTDFPKQVLKHDDGKITVTTDKNADANYQLKTDPRLVKEGDIVQVPYKIMVQPGGQISLGFLNTARNGWYGEELILGPGKHRGFYEQRVPVGEKETSLVIRNAHLATQGETTFTIKDIDLMVEEDPYYVPEYSEAEAFFREQSKDELFELFGHFINEQEQLLPSIENDHERNCNELSLLVLKYEILRLVQDDNKNEKFDAVIARDPIIALAQQDRSSPGCALLQTQIEKKIDVLKSGIEEIVDRFPAKKKAELIELYGSEAEVKAFYPHFDVLFDHIVNK